jgi:hypothetical protein
MLCRIGRYDEKHSQEQRDAVIRFQLDGGASAPETAKAAAAGELGVPPFEVSPTSCRVWAREARRERGEPGPTVGQEEAEEREYLKEEVARIRKIKEPPAKEIHAMGQALRTLDEIDKRAVKRAAHWGPAKPAPDAGRRTSH